MVNRDFLQPASLQAHPFKGDEQSILESISQMNPANVNEGTPLSSGNTVVNIPLEDVNTPAPAILNQATCWQKYSGATLMTAEVLGLIALTSGGTFLLCFSDKPQHGMAMLMVAFMLSVIAASCHCR